MNKKKVLFVAHVDSHIQNFHIPYLKIFKEQGYEVHVASNGDKVFDYCDVKYNLPFDRNPFSKYNFLVFKELKKIMDANFFSIIHCHTPVGGVLARLANRFGKHYKKTYMIYTAHGFHFYNGAPIKNWMIYYSIEKFCAQFTDVIITINKEDFNRAKKFRLKKHGHIEYVPGVGIDLNKILSVRGNREKLIKQLGISSDNILMLTAGELIDRKNQKAVIKSMVDLPNNVHFLICGEGKLWNELHSFCVEIGVSDRVHFLGFRTDLIEIMKSSDLFVFPSVQEGLPVALMEALASGLPCLASKIRGNTDLAQLSPRLELVNIEDFNSSTILNFINHISDIKLKDESQIFDECNLISKNHVETIMKDIYKL